VSRCRRTSWVVAVGWLAGVTGTGCPRDLEEPERGAGEPCRETAQCNPPGVDCGLIVACADQRCEAQATLVQPCPGGEPVFLPDAGDALRDAGGDPDGGVDPGDAGPGDDGGP